MKGEIKQLKNLYFTDYSHEEITIPINTSKKSNGGYLKWGENNQYPFYLWDLYTNSPILGGIINATTDFVCGDSIIGGDNVCNYDKETFDEVFRKLTVDYLVYGGCALEILRNYNGEVTEIYHVPFEKLRRNDEDDEKQIVYYCKDWSKYNKEILEYELFDVTKKQTDSILYYKGFKTREVYPIPSYYSAIKEVETDIRIGDFHLNAIANGLSSPYIINFNNGQPTDEVKKIIEKKFKGKHSGNENAGNTMIAFNDSKDNEVTITAVPSDNYDVKYKTLAEHCITTVCLSMRCSPVLIGDESHTTNGFSKTEYKELYDIYFKTVVKPIQKLLLGLLRKIYNVDMLQIVPYSIDSINEE